MIGVTPAQVSRLVSGERDASNDTLNEIARVFKLPPELVYQEAGHLPAESEEEKLIKQINKMMEGLSDESKQDIYEYARMRRRLEEDRSKYNGSNQPKPRHSGA